MIKPSELIDVVELTPLKLIDRRCFNILLANAWDDIGNDQEHSIHKADLLVNTKATDQIDGSIGRLMGSRVKVKIQRLNKTTGAQDAYVRSFPFLEYIDDPIRGDGLVYYKFPSKLREMIQDSTVFARLQKDVMFSLSSKYALALYEMIQKRGNLDKVWNETFPLNQIRSLLGVEKTKLTAYKNFKSRALLPAVQEVDFLSDYHVKFLVMKKGRNVEAITLSWHKKSQEEIKEAFQELRGSSLGRRERMNRQVEVITRKG
tara:strand:- start:2131 stop:2910 length:780 start_codon:yes stop_codon:yes gene_type:complete